MLVNHIKRIYKPIETNLLFPGIVTSKPQYSGLEGAKTCAQMLQFQDWRQSLQYSHSGPDSSNSK